MLDVHVGEVVTDNVEVVGVGTVEDVEVDVVDSGSDVDDGVVVVEVDVVESGFEVDVDIEGDVDVVPAV